MTSIVEMIRHYQRSIDKSSDNPNRLLHCIDKLHKLPVTVEHLQETGIGRTVNGLRKLDGEVGYAAKALVTKWKTMVASEEPEDEIGDHNGNSGQPDDDQEVEDDEDALESRLQIDESENIEPEVEEEKPDHVGKNSKHRDKHHSEKSSHRSSHHKKEEKSSRSHKPTEDEKPRDKHHSSHKDKKSDEKTKERHHKDRNKDSKKDSKTRSEKDKDKKDKDKPKTSESSSSSSSKKRKSESSAGIVIDSSMGASFADALGFLDMPSTSKKKFPKPSSSTSHSKSNSTATTTSTNLTTKIKTHPKPELVPDLLTKRPKLDPLPDIAEIVPIPPTISNNYKPLPLNQTVMECVFKENRTKPLTDEEAFGYSITSKKDRTKVFSGQKSVYRGEVPSLYDQCLRILQENIDALECTGGVPFDILKPVLERATVDQLLQIEDYNNYLIEDTDILWQQHCKRRFRGKQPEELESWREMYLRCKDEEDARFRTLTKKVKLSNEKKVPVKTTKLAYVDSYVKPPRNIVKKQHQYNTDIIATASPAARVSALNGMSSNAVKVGDTRLKVAAAIREALPQHNARVNPNKKAPLMAKTLNSMKKCFRR